MEHQTLYDLWSYNIVRKCDIVKILQPIPVSSTLTWTPPLITNILLGNQLKNLTIIKLKRCMLVDDMIELKRHEV